MKFRLLLPALLAISILGVGCQKDVRSINKNPQKYAGRSVKLTGIIRNVVSIPAGEGSPGMTLYQITDDLTGGDASLIWVLRGPDSSQKALPNPNNRISLEGIVEAERKVRNTVYSPVIIEKDAQEEIPREGPVSFG